MADIEIEIDGQKLTATPDQTVIQVADAAGIYIPRFCYHKHLSVAANCRMCLVEVEKSPKALPACATPVMPGMKVFTKSPKTIQAQRAVMEFLLINHPLDCPICDQGGECELQDIAMGYGSDHSRFEECKRAVADEDLGALIETEMTRCILCTRCVRFGTEVAGVRELGVTNRGGHAEISTYVEHAMTSEVSGNIIDLCPVGALTSKPYRYSARAWELEQSPSISPHDCLGTNLNVHTRYGKVMRVVARENAAINETWLSDRDRFSYTGLYHADRLEEPMAKIDGKWVAVEWQKAFEMIAAGLHGVIAAHGADKIGALASPSSTLEEFYLLQKIVRVLGSSHVDHRLRETDTTDQALMPAFPGMGAAIATFEHSDAVLLIGSNVRKEQPLLATRLRKAVLKGAAVAVINPVDYEFNFTVSAKSITAPQQWVAVLNGVLEALQGTSASHDAQLIADRLRGKQKVSVIVGALAMHHAQAAQLRYLASKIAEQCGGTVSFLTDGANAAGAWLAGMVPHRHAGGISINHHGYSASEMMEKPRKAYLLLNVEPDLDCANAERAVDAIKQAQFVAAISLYRNPALEAHADVILPMAAFTETSGTFVNAAGEWQRFTGVAQPFKSSRPAWKILRVLGNFLHLDGFDYESSDAVRHEVESLVDHMPPMTMRLAPIEANKDHRSGLVRVGEVPIYAIDNIVRHAEPLQAAQAVMEGDVNTARMHAETAKKYQLQNGDSVLVKQQHASALLSVSIDNRIAPDAVWIAGGIAASATLGGLFGELEMTKG